MRRKCGSIVVLALVIFFLVMSVNVILTVLQGGLFDPEQRESRGADSPLQSDYSVSTPRM